MLDVAIIGGGPAALSAALNCRQRNKTVCIFGRSLDSSLLFAAEKVDNYLGMPDVNGEEMLNRFYSHAVKNGVEFQECRVSQILNVGEHFMINAENNFIEAKSIILATGLSKSKGIAGEIDYLGKGVSYCATCDGMLYRNKKVVVVSENEEGEAEANFLADICKEVLYVPLYKNISHLKENVVVVDAKPKAVLGGGNKLTGLETDQDTISCDGRFFATPAGYIDGPNHLSSAYYFVHGIMMKSFFDYLTVKVDEYLAFSNYYLFNFRTRSIIKQPQLGRGNENTMIAQRCVSIVSTAGVLLAAILLTARAAAGQIETYALGGWPAPFGKPWISVRRSMTGVSSAAGVPWSGPRRKASDHSRHSPSSDLSGFASSASRRPSTSCLRAFTLAPNAAFSSFGTSLRRARRAVTRPCFLPSATRPRRRRSSRT